MEAFESEPQRCMEFGYSRRFTNGFAVNCARPNPGRFQSATLRECSSAQFDSALNLLSRPDGDLTQLGEWPEKCVDIAIIMIIMVARFSLSVAMNVLATSTIASVFTVMCSCLQSLLAHAQESVGHFQKSPVAKEGMVGRTMNMCL